MCTGTLCAENSDIVDMHFSDIYIVEMYCNCTVAFIIAIIIMEEVIK